VYYNLACMRSLQNDGPGAGDLLKKAIETGFIDIYRLRSDPDLRALRATELYTTITGGWPRILQAHLESNLKQAERIFSDKAGHYQVIRDEGLRIAIRSGM